MVSNDTNVLEEVDVAYLIHSPHLFFDWGEPQTNLNENIRSQGRPTFEPRTWILSMIANHSITVVVAYKNLEE